ncbi:hypothetical protein KDU71_06710 [Carboxylicivirga sediminis]|uniref:Uncharacterized protein n=1 Tax=Carboxylicivirga sediminis TaxID=2006564 RepID=A0A941IXB3_9BACT|nr:hypothetical protein [Carboxylicivirga sediminis]MBR8535244.1 hypothetical protein [Carboxylicivirga sediminis]
MNRGVCYISSIFLSVLLCFSICTHDAKAEGLSKRIVKSAVNVSGNEHENLYATSTNSLFELNCVSDGVITLTNTDKDMKRGVVTVFCKEMKEILLQATLNSNESTTFYSVNNCKCFISWALRGEGDTLTWSVKQDFLEGLSERSAIQIEPGMQEVSHLDNMDKWFVFTATKNGQVRISTVGLTGENTTLFVYKDSAEQMISSSNYAANTLQSEAVVSVEAGCSYLIKWSSAFTNKSYSWNLTYL